MMLKTDSVQNAEKGDKHQSEDFTQIACISSDHDQNTCTVKQSSALNCMVSCGHNVQLLYLLPIH